ncbi:MAG: glycoside hydrolase family 55 protein [Eubacterium sp.]|nr:glycoside hydrolase family 55 protein [Eubacterium sp.]
MDDISVRDYGALGDGQDYTAEIQAALNVGGRVYFPSGVYLISEPLVIKSDTYIIMESNTILKRNGEVTMNTSATTPLNYTSGPYAIFTNGHKTDSFTGYNGNGNITIEGGIIDCDGNSYNSASNGIAFAHGKNIRIKNITIKNVNYGHHIEMNSS